MKTNKLACFHDELLKRKAVIGRLWSRRRRVKGAIGIDEQPQGAADYAEGGGGQKGSGPAKMRGDGGCGDGGEGAAGLGAHIHEAGKRAGGALPEVRGEREVRALRNVERSRAQCQNRAGCGGSGDLRTSGHKDSRAHHAECRHAAASPPTAESSAYGVSNPAARRRAQRHGDERQHAVVAGSLEVQAANPGEVDKEPSEENCGRVSVAKIAESKGPNVLAPEHGGPREFGRVDGVRLRDALVNPFPFRVIQPGVLVRMVARHPIPCRTRRESQHGAHPEGGTPTQVNHDVANDGRRECGARAHAGED